MTVLVVDWLGRGGIAQSTEAWYAELSAAGREVLIVTRPDRELSSFAGDRSLPAPACAGRIRSHLALVRTAARLIAERRPKTVVVQNYVLPALEWPVYRAAARAGSQLVLVVHDHRLHSPLAGTHAGLARCIRQADAVVAHTRFVGGAVGRTGRRADVVVTPLPVPVGVLRRPGPSRSLLRPREGHAGRSLALHFGTLKRAYKGTSTVLKLAGAGVQGWRFALVGDGAPAEVEGVEVVRGFADSADLVAAVSESQATLLPYSYATQSGAVVLAQALGSAVVASAVGGIPEQVEAGVTGLLLPPGASVASWRQALVRLGDSAERTAIADAARRRVWAGHETFVRDIRRLVA